MQPHHAVLLDKTAGRALGSLPLLQEVGNTAVYLVTYDLRRPGKDYEPVHTYLRQFAYCKDLESVWLIDTNFSVTQIRDGLNQRIDTNDKTFVVRLMRDWAPFGYGCADSSP